MPADGAGAPATPGGGGGDQPGADRLQGRRWRRGRTGGRGGGGGSSSRGRRAAPTRNDGYGHRGHNLRNHRGAAAFVDPLLSGGQDPVPQHGAGENLDIVGCDEAAPVQQCSGLGAAHQAHQRPRACSEVEERVPAGGGDQSEGVAEDVVGDARVPDGDLDGYHLAGDSTGSSCSIGWCSN